MDCAAFFGSASSNAVGTLMVDYLVKPVERRLRYLFRFNNIVEELRKQKTKLNEERTRVQNGVEEAKLQPQTQVIEEYIESWLTEVENIFNDVQSLQCRIDENKRCFHWCPNWSWRYQLSKEMEKKTLAIRKVVDSSKFDRYGHPAPLPGLEFFGISEDYLASKSANSAFDQIMQALKDNGVNMIGVWGMGGVGKTTLVTEVGKKVIELQLFNPVIKVVVSQTPDIEKIQQKIVDLLRFELKNKTPEGKAEELWLRLKNEKKVLIILDDMWNELKLEKIGIPSGGNYKGCKIILTTRRRPVCESMASQVTISLGVFDEDEAWNLFKGKASLDEEKADAEIIKVAMEVTRECKGLPIAIVTLARALKDTKRVKGWEIALRKLKSSRLLEIGNIEEEKNAYMCLKISYDNLKKDTTKRCFLLCALYPEDHSIDVEDELVRYAWGLELYRNATSIDDVRYEVMEAIDNLKDSCLLLEDEERSIKVHDVVRDVALWIASKEDNGLTVKSRVGSENENFKENLEILSLNVREIPFGYFGRMRKLKVLSLDITVGSGWDDCFFSLNALESLTNLRALELKDYLKHLKDISTLANLTKLEILSLHGSKLEESMDKLGELKNLRVLDLGNCEFFSGFPCHWIQRLVEIEELYLHRSMSTDALGELSFLPRLTSLSLELSSLNFPEGFVFPRLERYRIYINRSFTKRIISYRSLIISSRSLEIAGGFPLNVLQNLLPNVELLEVISVKDIEEIKCLADRTPGNVSVATTLQNLKYLIISSCVNLQVIFQMEKAENHRVLLSKLKCLFLELLPDLEYIWKMPAQHASLGSLETIEIYQCGKLKSLFSFSLAQSLARLEKLLVESCDRLEQIVEDLGGDEQEISPDVNLDKFLCLPKLRTLMIEKCDSLEYIFPNLMAPLGLSQLKDLRIKSLPQLKQIRKHAREMVENGIELPQHQLLLSLTDFEVSYCQELSDATIHLKTEQAYLEGIQVSKLKKVSFANTKELSLGNISDYNLIPEAAPEGLNQLTSFTLSGCESLEYLVDTTKEHVPDIAFSNLVELSMKALGGLKTVCNGQIPKDFLQNLKQLTVVRCWEFQEIIRIDRLKENHPQVLSNLEHLELSELPELRWILKGSAHYFSLQSLKVVKIYRCEKLKSLFSPSLIQSLQQLEILEVKECEELKTLFAELESDGDTESNCPMCFPRLTTLSVSYCGRLEFVLPITSALGLPHLESVLVRSCYELKQVFDVAKEHDGDLEHCIELPCLKSLELYDLTDLSSFGPENYFIKTSVLENLSLSSCPQLMKYSIKQEVNNNVRIHLGEVPLFDFKELLHNAKELTLYRILDQENLISGVNQEGEKCKDLLECLVDATEEHMPTTAFLTNVVHLSICDFEKLLEVFRIDCFLYNREENEAPLLSKLDSLCLESLPELRHILKGPTRFVSLGSLTYVKIEKCNKLESLFSFSLIPSLTLLEQLWIRECDELETVFAELEGDDETESNMLLASAQGLPSLEILSLERLRKLRSFGPVNYSIEEAVLNYLCVTDCPLLSNFPFRQDDDRLLQKMKCGSRWEVFTFIACQSC